MRTVRAFFGAAAIAVALLSTGRPSLAQTSTDEAQGIKVHGHWTIEVRDPDGTLVTYREFENSLTAAGGQFLAALMGGTTTIVDSYGVHPLGIAPVPSWEMINGSDPVYAPFAFMILEPAAYQLPLLSWEVKLAGNPSPCLNDCLIGTSADSNTIFQNLVFSVPPAGPTAPVAPGLGLMYNNSTFNLNAGKLVLSGSATASVPGTVTTVSTNLIQCDATCITAVPFTSTSSFAPVTDIVPNQFLQVTVVISFS